MHITFEYLHNGFKKSVWLLAALHSVSEDTVNRLVPNHVLLE